MESDKKPSQLEQEILRTAQKSIDVAIQKTLQDDYNSPLKKLIVSVVEENSKELRTMISDSFVHVIRRDEFKQAIVNAFSHKIARTIISNNDGLFDKVSKELKQDSVFVSKMTLAVDNVINECLNENKAKALNSMIESELDRIKEII